MAKFRSDTGMTNEQWGQFVGNISPAINPKIEDYNKRIKDFETLTYQDKAKTLKEAEEYGVIDRKTRVDELLRSHQVEQFKIKEDYKKKLNFTQRVISGTAGETTIKPITDMVLKPIIERGSRVVQDYWTAQNAKYYSKLMNTLNKSVSTDVKQIVADKNSGKITSEQASALISQLNNLTNPIRQKQSSTAEEMAKIDPVKAGADVFMSGLDVYGAGSMLTKSLAAAGQVASSAVGRVIKGGVLPGAAFGGVYGGAEPISQAGKDVKIEDIAKGAGTGALVGGALGGVLAGAGEVASKVRLNKLAQDNAVKIEKISKTSKPKINTPEESIAAIDEAMATTGKKSGVVSKLLAKSRFTRGLQNASDNIRAYGPTGTKVSNKLNLQAMTEGINLSVGEQIANKMKVLKPDSLAKTWSAVSSRSSAGLTKNELSVYKDLVKVFDDTLTEYGKAGIKIGQIPKYVPRMINPAKKLEIISYLESNGRVKDAEIIKEMYTRSLRPQKSSAEFHRAIEKLPAEFYIDDPVMLFSNWNSERAARLAEAQMWGPNLEYLKKDIGKIATESNISAGKYTQNLYDTWRFGIDDGSSAASSIMRGARSLQVITKMPLSAFSNAFQSVNTAVKGGAINTFKSIGEYATAKGRTRLNQLALDSGINVHYTTDDARQALYKLTSASKTTSAAELLLKFNGFSASEKFNRLVASGTGERYIQQLAKNPLGRTNARLLRDVGLDPTRIASNGLTKQDLALGIREFVGGTQFYTSAKDLPSWTTSTEFGKTVTHLGKFSIKQAEFLKDSIIKEAVKGNFMPLVRYVVVGTAAGEVASLIRDSITGKKREYSLEEVFNGLSKGQFEQLSSRLLEDADRAGGFGYLVQGLESTKYGDTLLEKGIKGFGGPVMSDAYEILAIVGSLMEAETDSGRAYSLTDAAKFGIKNVPLLDPALTAVKQYGGVNYKQQFGDSPLTKALDTVSEPYDPRTSKYWELRNKIGNFKLGADQIKEITDAERNGDIKNTEFYKTILKTSENPKTSDRNKKLIKDFLTELDKT